MTKIKIEKGKILYSFNGKKIIITDIFPNVGFWYKTEDSEDIPFCNTMYETLNFIPVF